MSKPSFVFHRPDEPTFDKHGTFGWRYQTTSSLTDHLLLECHSEAGYSLVLREADCEFSYYVVRGSGEVVVDGTPAACAAGDVVVIPPGHTFTFNGRLTLFLVNTPKWSEGQEQELPKGDAERPSAA